ncbi:MAG: beta-lactamase family protein [Gemmatimonadota bacterium]|nr:MAG: beta-lactamase family protein [Gemmatimonadota bacterium]
MRLAVPFVMTAAFSPILPAQQPGEISYRDESIMPDGILGDRIRSVIETLNANRPEAVEHFLQQDCTEQLRNFAPLEEHLDVFLGLHRQWGSVRFHGIRSYEPPRPNQTIVILKDSNFDAWRAFVIQLDAADDNRIASLSLTDARVPTNVTEPDLSQADLVQQTSDLIERVCERDVFSGTVLVARQDEVLYSHACGEASKRFHVANKIDTKFNLGSMNKMFTATAINQLVERGVLGYDETIDAFVDESWLPPAITSRVTVHHLLTHTSGLGSYFNETYWNGSRELYRSVDDFKPLVQGERLAFEPGARFRYSNTGMLILGVVIESATGESYFDYVTENIYEPAGMVNSDSYEMDFPVENLAIGYIPARESEYGWENNIYKHVIKGGPAGGGFSTVNDMYRFARALQTGKLVSPETLELMWTDHSGDGYGYGFNIDDGPAGKVVGHGGGFPGLNSNLDIFVDTGYVVVVMSNYDQAASSVARQINQLIGRMN